MDLIAKVSIRIRIFRIVGHSFMISLIERTLKSLQVCFSLVNLGLNLSYGNIARFSL